MKQKIEQVARTTKNMLIPTSAIKIIGQQIFYFLLAFIFSQGKILSIYSPLTPALTGAVPYSGLLSTLLGSIIGYFSLGFKTTSLKYITVVITIATIRWTFSNFEKLNNKKLFAPIVSSIPLITISVLLSSMFVKISPYNFMISLSEGLFCAGLSYFISESFTIINQNKTFDLTEIKNISTFQQFSSIIITISLLIMSLNQLEYTSISIGRILAMTIIMIFSQLYGVIGGTISAVSMGIVIGLSDISMLYLSICYSFAGLISGIFSFFGKISVSVFFFASVILVTILLQDSTIVVPILIELFISTILFLITPTKNLKLFIFKIEKNINNKVAKNDYIFSQIDFASKSLFNVSNSINLVAKKINQKKNTQSTATEKNDKLLLAENNRRKREVRSLVTSQIDSIAKILADISSETDENTISMKDISDELSISFENIGICVKNIEAIKKNEIVTIEFITRDSEIISSKKDEILDIIQSITKLDFTQPLITIIDNLCKFTITQIGKYCLDISSLQHNCKGYSLCGDCCSYFYDGKGQAILMISDGMGCGGKAAVDSTMATGIMTTLLKANIGFESALNLVNLSIIAKSTEERLTTMDIATFDLFTGRVIFTKAGGTLTYIKKNTTVEKINISSLPLGILKEIKIGQHETCLAKNDIIVMISDGAIMSGDQWLIDLLKEDYDSAKILSRKIMQNAIEKFDGLHEDDITILCSIVKKERE